MNGGMKFFTKYLYMILVKGIGTKLLRCFSRGGSTAIGFSNHPKRFEEAGRAPFLSVRHWEACRAICECPS